MTIVIWMNPQAKKDRNSFYMSDEVKIKSSAEVDKGLVAMFLKMTPEERLKANDNAVRAIMEMRNAFSKPKTRTES